MNTQFSRYGLEMDLQSYDVDSERIDVALQSLESITLAHDIASDIPGMDETTHKLLEHSIECFMKLGRIGAPNKKIVPSNEAYKTHDISEVAIEGFGEGIRNVFSSILNAIKKALEWMWDLLKRIFGRSKNREEKIETMKSQSEEIKQKVKEMPENEKKGGPYPRSDVGWFTKVNLHRIDMIKRVVTSRGMMGREDLNKYQTEMARVFQLQSKNMQVGMHVKNGVDTAIHYEPPLPLSHDASISKLVTTNPSDKVYLSMEFGGGEYVYVCVPDASKSSQKKDSSRWIEGLNIGEVKAPNPPDLNKYKVLEGEMANPDHILDMLQAFNKLLKHHADQLESFLTAKKLFVKDMEKMLKDEGVTMWSSREKKTLRDTMMGHLRYFKKVMDQPALAYYGKCDGILNTFEYLAMYILQFNKRSGNHLNLRKNETK